jgi:hypothetical protein
MLLGDKTLKKERRVADMNPFRKKFLEMLLKKKKLISIRLPEYDNEQSVLKDCCDPSVLPTSTEPPIQLEEMFEL